ncbi:outer membrane protein [Pedobacter sp. AW31-3R]|uniref:outer membrane protein n=1 Tax=Pedobacter sp. AW31-3R TaxID=3445781 RepID=UPI003F9F4C5A
MKKKLLIAIAVTLSFGGYAQTKGTSALGLGVSLTKTKTNYTGGSLTGSNEDKTNSFTLGYGNFIKDNAKLGVEFSYSKYDFESNNGNYADGKSYGGNVNYQQYYPLLKKLYAYAGGRVGYFNQKIESLNPTGPYNTLKQNEYSVGAYGGLTWFVSQRFAFETNLLSANIIYSKTEETSPSNNYESNRKATNFNLTSQGFINNLGFKIYLLF